MKSKTKKTFIEIPLDRISRDLAFWACVSDRLHKAGLLKKTDKGLPKLFIQAS
jgi:hypothetical protein